MMSFRLIGLAPLCALLALAAVLPGCESVDERLVFSDGIFTDKKKKKPPPPPPPGSELSSQPWSRPEKDWEGGRPAFMPTSN
ncbi:MAG: hypothetical protein ACR2OZ_14050 [Verrucomicrobiales bacterium]